MLPNANTLPAIEEEIKKIQFPKSLVVLLGVPLSGKTTLGETLQKITNYRLLDVDQARSELPDEKLNGNEATIMLSAYELNHQKAETAIKEGHPVIVTATYSSIISRVTIARLTQRLSVPLIFINLISPEQINQRLDERNQIENSSNLSNVRTLDHYLSVKNRFEPFKNPVLGYPVYEVSTNQDKAKTLNQILNILDPLKKPISA